MIKFKPLIALPFILLSACSWVPSAPDDPRYAPAMPAFQERQPMQNGAIYQAGYDAPLFEDVKARRIGDTLTVILLESTSATKTANTKTKKDSTSKIPNPTILGSTPQFNLPGVFPLASTTNNNLAFDIEGQHQFDGEGESDQSNKLQGTISVTVSDVLPNGNLVVRGEKWIALNQGEEYVRLSGIVRPIDIQSNNTVTSDKIANARISYSGRGQLFDANAPGWLHRIFTSPLWPT